MEHYSTFQTLDSPTLTMAVLQCLAVLVGVSAVMVKLFRSF